MAENIHMHPAGTRHYFSTDGVSYTEVDDLIGIDAPDLEHGEADDGTLTTPNRILKMAPGWSNPGRPKFRTLKHKTQFAVLRNHMTSRTTLYWRTLFAVITGESTGSKQEYQGWIKAVNPFGTVERGSEDMVAVEWTVCATTQMTFTAGS